MALSSPCAKSVRWGNELGPQELDRCVLTLVIVSGLHLWGKGRDEMGGVLGEFLEWNICKSVFSDRSC